jgi:hypothetical protein
MANSVDVLGEVSDLLKNSSEKVKERLVSTLVEREIASRVDLLDKALVKLKEAKKELDKIKPDIETFDEQGNKQAGQFSKAKWEEKKKATENKEKLEKAVEAALSGESFDKLRDLMK